jgi:hypothetical protein
MKNFGDDRSDEVQEQHRRLVGLLHRAARGGAERYQRDYAAGRRFGRMRLFLDGVLVVAMIGLFGLNAALLAAPADDLPVSETKLEWAAHSGVFRVGEERMIELKYQFDADAHQDAYIRIHIPDALSISVPDGEIRGSEVVVRVGPEESRAERRLAVRFLARSPAASPVPVAAFLVSGGEQIRATTLLTVDGVAIDLALDPEVSYTNGRTIANLKITSRAVIAFPSVRMELSADTGIDPGFVTAFEFQEIAAGQIRSVPIAFSTETAGTFPLHLTFFERTDGKETMLGASDVFVKVVQPSSRVVLEEDTLQTPIVIGEERGVRVSYQELGGRVQPGVKNRFFGVELSGSLADVAIVRAERGAVVGRRVLWDVRPEVDLDEVRVEELFVTIPDSVDPQQFIANNPPSLTLSSLLAAGEVVSGRAQIETSGTPVTLHVRPKIVLRATARYFTPEGDQIGRGPLPPRVNETTRYWVTWSVQSLLSQAEPFEITARLPEYVQWTGRVAATMGASPRYNETQRAVTWELPELDPVLGDQRPAASVSFELAVTPQELHVGSPIEILESSVLTMGEVTKNIASVSTELREDARETSGGVVAP